MKTEARCGIRRLGRWAFLLQQGLAAVLVLYGLGLFIVMGITALPILGLGLLYFALAWSVRHGIPSAWWLLLLAADGLMGWAAAKIFLGTWASVSLNARMQGLVPGPVDYLTLDLIASALVLLLLAALLLVLAASYVAQASRRPGSA